jgi:hypothetical protein
MQRFPQICHFYNLAATAFHIAVVVVVLEYAGMVVLGGTPFSNSLRFKIDSP